MEFFSLTWRGNRTEVFRLRSGRSTTTQTSWYGSTGGLQADFEFEMVSIPKFRGFGRCRSQIQTQI